MNLSKFKIATFLTISIILLLLTQRLWAQAPQSSQVPTESLESDDERPPYLMLAFENSLTSLDWQGDQLPRRTLFALKTNLLFDILTAVNLEIEVPIGDRYSVAGEWIFPWWLSDSSQRCFELLSGTIEGRYWFGNRSHAEQLIGWAAGIYAGGGYYDVEWDGTGYQGEHLLAAGISGAYAHKIGKNLRAEYSLGIGYLSTKYRKYSAQWCDQGQEWNLLRTRSGTKRWFGPTRCRVSLSWMLHRADKRGGER